MTGINSAAPDQATEKRSIQMKHFRDAASIDACVRDQTPIALGQVVGFASAVKQREGVLPNGERNFSWLTIGEFEATNYKTGEVFGAMGIFLPRYFAEALESTLKSSPTGVAFAIEILVEPTGKGIGQGIPYAYAVKRLTARRADSPLNALKRQMAAQGTLRLPAPPPADHDDVMLPAMAEGAIKQLSAGAATTSSPSAEVDPAEVDPAEFASIPPLKAKAKPARA